MEWTWTDATPVEVVRQSPCGCKWIDDKFYVCQTHYELEFNYYERDWNERDEVADLVAAITVS